MADRFDPEATAPLEPVTLPNLPTLTDRLLNPPPGRHRVVLEPNPGAESGTRWLGYGAVLGLAVAVSVVAWGASGSSQGGTPLTPLGTVAPYPLTTVLPAPASDTSTTAGDTAASRADSGTYTAPTLRSLVPQPRKPRSSARRVVPPLVVTTTTQAPVTSTPEATETTTETNETPESETDVEPQQGSRGHRWRHWDGQQ